MTHRAKLLGLIDAYNVAIDASKITAYEHSVPEREIPEDDPTSPN